MTVAGEPRWRPTSLSDAPAACFTAVVTGTAIWIYIPAGIIGTAVACGAGTLVAAPAVRYVRTRRMRRGDAYVASQLDRVPDLRARLQNAPPSIHFPMPRPLLHAENVMEPTDIGRAAVARSYYFAEPEARLEAGLLIVEQGPARRAVVPIEDMAAIAAARPRDTPGKPIARYIFTNRPSVLIELRREREVCQDKVRTVSAILFEVIDARTCLESLRRASGIEPDYAPDSGGAAALHAATGAMPEDPGLHALLAEDRRREAALQSDIDAFRNIRIRSVAPTLMLDLLCGVGVVLFAPSVAVALTIFGLAITAALPLLVIAVVAIYARFGRKESLPSYLKYWGAPWMIGGDWRVAARGFALL